MKIIWFNPTFCKLENINIGKYFLKLIDKHFNQNNILHKILNKKTLKISYSSTKCFFEIINNHNKEIIRKYDRTRHYTPETTLTDYMYLEKREEEDLPASKTALTHRYNCSKTT